MSKNPVWGFVCWEQDGGERQGQPWLGVSAFSITAATVHAEYRER